MMKRRKFCHHVATGSAFLAGILGRGLPFTMSSAYSQEKAYYKWVVLYWMPYDNDLVRFGEPIIEMLARGTQNSEIAVVVQSDYWGDSQMRRRQIINGTVTEVEVSESDSSNASVFAAYLDWTNQAFTAEHWAVIVVGHGGRINDISPDDHGSNDQSRTWMRVDQFADTVSSFNQSVNGRVELLFFQNCNKATLEVVYEARNCAKYTLASQLILGAPNYYYKDFLENLTSLSDGREAAITIMNSESPDMFHTLTLVDNQAIRCVPERLSRLLQSILEGQLPVISSLDIQVYHYFDEQHCDVLLLLDYFASISDQELIEFTEFADFLGSSVIASYKIGGELYGGRSHEDSYLENLCGLSLYLPETRQDSSRYSFLALYQDVDLVSLYRKIIAD